LKPHPHARKVLFNGKTEDITCALAYKAFLSLPDLRSRQPPPARNNRAFRRSAAGGGAGEALGQANKPSVTARPQFSFPARFICLPPPQSTSNRRQHFITFFVKFFVKGKRETRLTTLRSQRLPQVRIRYSKDRRFPTSIHLKQVQKSSILPHIFHINKDNQILSEQHHKNQTLFYYCLTAVFCLFRTGRAA
jgi:hypothetical protein